MINERYIGQDVKRRFCGILTISNTIVSPVLNFRYTRIYTFPHRVFFVLYDSHN
jgi:hypothetical protein